jgi:hypothetical protein
MSSTYFSDIDEYLEVENCFSIRWIANSLQITLPVAQQVVEDYKAKNKQVHLSYLVSGLDLLGARLFVVSTEEQLSATKSKFSIVNSTTIYSVQKDNTNNYNLAVANSDFDQAADLLMMKHPNCVDFLHNTLGRIKLSNLEIKPIGDRIVSAQASGAVIEGPALSSSGSGASGATSTIKKESAESHISRVFANKSTAPPLKSKSSIQASSFFNKSTTGSVSAPLSTKTAAKEMKSMFSKSQSLSTPSQESASQPSSAPETTASQLNEEEEEGEDAEWDDGSGYKVDKSRLAKRALTDGVSRRRVIADGDEDEAEVEATDLTGDDAEEIQEEGDAGTGARKKKAKVLHVHGAMDSYMEDVAIAEFKAEAAVVAAGHEPVSVKRTKQKLVEKVGFSMLIVVMLIVSLLRCSSMPKATS